MLSCTIADVSLSCPLFQGAQQLNEQGPAEARATKCWIAGRKNAVTIRHVGCENVSLDVGDRSRITCSVCGRETLLAVALAIYHSDDVNKSFRRSCLVAIAFPTFVSGFSTSYVDDRRFALAAGTLGTTHTKGHCGLEAQSRRMRCSRPTQPSQQNCQLRSFIAFVPLVLRRSLLYHSFGDPRSGADDENTTQKCTQKLCAPACVLLL